MVNPKLKPACRTSVTSAGNASVCLIGRTPFCLTPLWNSPDASRSAATNNFMTTETSSPAEAMADNTTKRKRLTPAERMQRRAERYFKLRGKGGAYYDKGRAVLLDMISAGLTPGQPIVINGESFALVDNYVPGKTAGKYVMIEQFELKPISQKKAREFEKAATA